MNNYMNILIKKLLNGDYVSIQERRAITANLLIDDRLPKDWIKQMESWNTEASNVRYLNVSNGKVAFDTQEIRKILKLIEEGRES